MGYVESKQTATESSVSLVLSKPNLLLLSLVKICAPHTCFIMYSWESLKSELCSLHSYAAVARISPSHNTLLQMLANKCAIYQSAKSCEARCRRGWRLLCQGNTLFSLVRTLNTPFWLVGASSVQSKIERSNNLAGKKRDRVQSHIKTCLRQEFNKTKKSPRSDILSLIDVSYPMRSWHQLANGFLSYILFVKA